jgi:hypothetical protein
MEFSASEALWDTFQATKTSVCPPIDQCTLTVEGVEDLNQHGVVTIHCGSRSEGASYITLPILIDNGPARADSA